VTPEELALLYVEQLRAWRDGVPAQRRNPTALFVWEELISSEPERAWPVFEHALRRAADDESLEQIWYRLRLLLYRHYETFRERAAELLTRHARFAVIAASMRSMPPAMSDSRSTGRS